MAKSKKNETGDTTPGDDSQTGPEPLDSQEAGPVDETRDEATDAAPQDKLSANDPAETDETATGPDDSVASGAADETMSDEVKEALEGADMTPHGGNDVASTESDDTLAEPAAAPEPALDPMIPPAGPSEPQVVKETVVQRKGGFVPMMLGGVVAAALGYAAAEYPDIPFIGPGEPTEDPFVTETQAALRSQDERIETLSAQAQSNEDAVAALDLDPVTASLSTVEGQIADMEGRLSEIDGTLANLSSDISALDERVTTLEKQPLVDAVSPETIAAYERELDSFRAEIAEQQEAFAAARAEQQEAIEAARDEVQAMADRALASEANAEKRARLAESRAALATLATRLRDGQPFAEAMAVLSENEVSVPEPLTANAEDGLPTVSTLITEFPAAARDALGAARSAGTSDVDDGGLSGFFQSQLGARSVTPREGDDPDAILSRAEAALRGGDLDTALAEIRNLPEAAQTELSDWTAMAQKRRDALAAVNALAQELNQE